MTTRPAIEAVLRAAWESSADCHCPLCRAAQRPGDPAAALDAYEAEIRGVRTIESAPDDQRILAFFPCIGWEVASFVEDAGVSFIIADGRILYIPTQPGIQYWREHQPTHWQALPPAPRGCDDE